MKLLHLLRCRLNLPFCAYMLFSAQLFPDSQGVALKDFLLAGVADEAGMAFTLTMTAEVKDKAGAEVKALEGSVALTELPTGSDFELRREGAAYLLKFEKEGKFPVELRFRAKVEEDDDLRSVNLKLVSAPLRKLTVAGLPPEVKLEVTGATQPVSGAEGCVCHLSADRTLSMQWKVAAEEVTGKLFYAASSIAELAVSPGLLRQSHLVRAEILQGELEGLDLRLDGEGEVVRVEGKDLLSWRVVKEGDGIGRRLVARLSRPQTGEYVLLVSARRALGPFPLEVAPLRVLPLNAIRNNGYLRLSNEGAVKLEVKETTGLSRVSPELFPQAGEMSEAKPNGGRSFAFRHSGDSFSFRALADDVLPEVNVSQSLLYVLGENDLSIRAELELDVREAPLREFGLLVPSGFSPAGLRASDLSDYFLTRVDDESSRLRLVFSKPVIGRALIELELESNVAPTEGEWSPPQLTPEKVKTLRGNVGVSVAPGGRVKATGSEGLVEMATAFFPEKRDDLQLAFRIKNEDWNLQLTYERIDRSLRVDALQLFSIGEGVAYGSTTLHFYVTGAPVSELEVETPPSYANVEFVGKDVRSWEETANGYKCRLHAPQAGAYSLLVTYDLRFDPAGEVLSLSGVRPVGAKVERGYVIAASHHYSRERGGMGEQLSGNLLELEPAEVPAEYRLLYDAPLVAAFRYAGRPLEADLALRPFAHAESVRQVADYAGLFTCVSAKGEVVTDARYLVKNKGLAHFRVSLPEGFALWSARVNDRKVTPVAKGSETLVPLPQSADPNQVATVDLKIAEKVENAGSLILRAPAVTSAPSLMTKWRVEPERGHRLKDLSGYAEWSAPRPERGGFAWLGTLLSGGFGSRPLFYIGLSVACALAGFFLVRRLARTGAKRGALRTNRLGLLASCCFVAAAVSLIPVGKAGFGPIEEVALGDPGLTYLLPPLEAGPYPAFYIENQPEAEEKGGMAALAWLPLAVGLLVGFRLLVLKLRGGETTFPSGQAALCWTGVFWSGLLSSEPVGWFCMTLLSLYLLHAALPALLAFRELSEETREEGRGRAEGSAQRAVTACLLFGLVCFVPFEGEARGLFAKKKTVEQKEPAKDSPSSKPLPLLIDKVSHTVVVEKERAKVTTVVDWRPRMGERLDLLRAPAVLTSVDVVPGGPVLSQDLGESGAASYFLTTEKGAVKKVSRGFPLFGRGSLFSRSRRANAAGSKALAKGHRVTFTFELAVTRQGGYSSLALPEFEGLIHSADLRVDGADLLVESPQAVSVTEDHADANSTSAHLRLSPGKTLELRWRPRTRDIRKEKAVLYAEFAQLFVPAAGIVEGMHEARVRPAQGRAAYLEFATPPGLTITDVERIDGLESWRFDPDASRLSVRFDPPMSKPFILLARSQLAASPLPYEREVGPLYLVGAAGQVGMVAVATGATAQVDEAMPVGMANLNLEDFPFERLSKCAEVSHRLTPRRAYRYADPASRLRLGIVAVEPDVRVTSRESLSLGEDRILLAAELQVSVTRAGVFQLSFPLPDTMEVETLTGDSLSHWNESDDENGTRLVTLHLKDKLMGTHSFEATLVGPGARPGKQWPAPRLALREAAKHAGALLLHPERGLRVEVAERRGVSSVDPKIFGITDKGVSAFRFLRADNYLSLDLVKVDPWVTATMLQDVTARKGLLEVRARVDYLVENAGVRAFHIRLPEGAAGERIRGEQVEDVVRVPFADGNGTDSDLREVRLRRRIIGPYSLDVSYHLPSPEGEEDAAGLRRTEALVSSLGLPDAHSLRAFLALRAGGRLQLETPDTTLPDSLRPIEWHSIPENLRRKAGSADANLAFRALRADYDLPLVITGHPADQTLPARIRSVDLSSTFSGAGYLLTDVSVRLEVGDKERLAVVLPENAKFWSAFVNGQAVAARSEAAKLFVPLEENVLRDGPTEVRFLYTVKLSAEDPDEVDVLLRGPRIDLPLENVRWTLRLPDDLEADDFEGSTLELREGNATEAAPFAFDLEGYVQGESRLREAGEQRAEALLEAGADLIAGGRRLKAREALRSAWRLSRSDKSFNEDARVQLRNLKLNDALVCLANRRAKHVEENDENLTPLVLDLDARGDDPFFTDDDARALLTADPDYVRSLRLIASSIVDHQDAALAAPAAIRPNLPQRGSSYRFERPLRVENFADLSLRVRATRRAQAGAAGGNYLILFGLFAFTALMLGLLRRKAARS